MSFDQVEALIAKGRFADAHSALLPLLADSTLSNMDIAAANSLMSIVVSAEPSFDEAGDFGLSYLQKALQQAPHFGAALNVVGCFGDKPTMHRDGHLLLLAIFLLETDFSTRLTSYHRNLIREKQALLRKLTWPNDPPLPRTLDLSHAKGSDLSEERTTEED